MQDRIKITNIVKLYAMLLLSEKKKKHGYEIANEF